MNEVERALYIASRRIQDAEAMYRAGRYTEAAAEAQDAARYAASAAKRLETQNWYEKEDSDGQA